MQLPAIKGSDGITKQQQITFGGLNHNIGASDGQLWDMENMTGDYYPVLASRKRGCCTRRCETGKRCTAGKDWHGWTAQTSTTQANGSHS